MKIIGKILVVVFLVAGCSQTSEKKVNEDGLKTFFTSKAMELDKTSTVEQFTYIESDTVTLKNQYNQLFSGMNKEAEKNRGIVSLLIEKIKDYKKLQTLTKDIDNTLYTNYKSNADETFLEAKALLATDSLLLIDMAKLDSMIKIADDSKPVAYVAKCYFVLKNKNQSVVKDTARIILDLDYNIIDYPEYSRKLNAIYKPISGFIYK